MEQGKYLNHELLILKALESGGVSFESNTCEFKGIIIDVQMLLMETIEEHVSEIDEGLDVPDIMKLLDEQGFSQEEVIEIMKEELQRRQERYRGFIAELKQKSLRNSYQEEVIVNKNYLPQNDSLDKVIRYETALQRSIIKNIELLNKLKGVS